MKIILSIIILLNTTICYADWEDSKKMGDQWAEGDWPCPTITTTEQNNALIWYLKALLEYLQEQQEKDEK